MGKFFRLISYNTCCFFDNRIPIRICSSSIPIFPHIKAIEYPFVNPIACNTWAWFGFGLFPDRLISPFPDLIISLNCSCFILGCELFLGEVLTINYFMSFFASSPTRCSMLASCNALLIRIAHLASWNYFVIIEYIRFVYFQSDCIQIDDSIFGFWISANFLFSNRTIVFSCPQFILEMMGALLFRINGFIYQKTHRCSPSSLYHYFHPSPKHLN